MHWLIRFRRARNFYCLAGNLFGYFFVFNSISSAFYAQPICTRTYQPNTRRVCRADGHEFRSSLYLITNSVYLLSCRRLRGLTNSPFVFGYRVTSTHVHTKPHTFYPQKVILIRIPTSFPFPGMPFFCQQHTDFVADRDYLPIFLLNANAVCDSKCYVESSYELESSEFHVNYTCDCSFNIAFLGVIYQAFSDYAVFMKIFIIQLKSNLLCGLITLNGVV